MMNEGPIGIDVGAIFQNRRWQNEASQVIARTYLRDLNLTDDLNWTYEPSWLTRHATLLQLAATTIRAESNVAASYIKLGRLWEASAGLPDSIDRVGIALLAAVAYEVGGSSANGAAVLNKYRTDLEHNDYLLLRALRLLLKRQLLKLRSLLSDDSNFDPETDDPLAIAIIAALDDFGEFLLSGSIHGFESAQLALDGAIDFATQSGAVREHLIASSLRRLTDVIRERSIWNVLAPMRPRSHIWKQYLLLLARGQGRDLLEGHSITELWPSQRKAIESGVLDPFVSSLVVRMPTSSGKTRVAELAIVQTFVDFPNAKAIYVAPYRALANELLASFRRLLGDLGFAVASSIGSYDYDDVEEQLIADADLAILTPERLDLLLRIRSEALSQVRLVILDEGHILEDVARGAKVELLLTRLRTRLPNARFLVASAVISADNLIDLSTWLKSRVVGAKKAEAVTPWRPSLQQVATFNWQGNSGFIRLVDPDARPGEVQTFLPGVISKRTVQFVNPKTLRRNSRRLGQDKSDIAAELALKLSALGPVLVYVVQPAWTMSVARVIAELVAIDPVLRPEWWGNTGAGLSRSEQIARDWSADDELEFLFSKGVAVHHGDMPEALKEAVERDARDKRFRIIVATGTLSSGVNIPIRSVIFHSSTRYEDERVTTISPADYWNVAGRAGRAGLETEGLIVHIVVSDLDKQAFEYFQKFPKNGADLTSRLLWSALDLRSNPDSALDIEERLDPEILAIAAEEVDLDNAGVVIDQLLQNSLAAEQAPRHHISLDDFGLVLKSRASRIFEQLPDARRRVAFAQTGLASDICLQIASNLEASPDVFAILQKGSVEELILAVIPLIADVGAMSEVGVPLSLLLSSLSLWLTGASVLDVIKLLQLEAMNEADARKIIDRFFRYYMPWYISGAVRIAACVFEVEISAFSDFTKMLPAIVRHGLPSRTSCYAMSVGIPTRRVAIQVGDQFDRFQPEGTFADFKAWLGAISSVRFLEEYSLEGDLLSDVFETLEALRRDNNVLDSLRNGEILPRIVWINIIDTRETMRLAERLLTGTEIQTRRAYVDLLDRNAIEVIFDGSVFGSPDQSDSRLLAAAVDSGLILAGRVLSIHLDAKKVQVEFFDKSFEVIGR